VSDSDVLLFVRLSVRSVICATVNLFVNVELELGRVRVRGYCFRALLSNYCFSLGLGFGLV